MSPFLPFPATRSALAAGTLALCCVSSAFAQSTTPPPGRLLASNCFQCHGTNGKGPGFDTLAGKSASDIYKELVEMRAGKEGPGIMTTHSMGYTDAQLKLIAQYFSTQR